MVRLISHGKSVFKDITVLDFNWVPKELPHREKQMQRLYTLFTPVVNSNISQNAFLFGTVGSGKTATAKRFCMDFQQDARTKNRGIDFVVVNCRSLRGSEQGLILKILMHFDQHFPDRGFSLSEMMSVLRKHIENRALHLIIVLDEAEVVLKKSGSNIVYDLSRFDDEKLSSKGSVSLLMISQKYIYDMLDEAALSTFKRTNAIEFGRYSEEELGDIVQQRVTLAFHEGAVQHGSILLIAEIASELGDARYAIELLEKAGMLADEEGSDKVTPEHVRGAKATIYTEIGQDLLSGLERGKAVLLLAIARAMRLNPYLTTGEMEKSYTAVCEEYGEEKKGHTQIWQYMKDLDALGLIDIRKSAEGPGKTSLISLTDVPAKILKEKLEEMLEEDGRRKTKKEHKVDDT